jgi:N-dimethylarginine dimethylaminohydrolase
MGKNVKYFLEVPLPHGNVHIDGLFMVLDEKLCVIYEPMFDVFPCRLYEDGNSSFRNVMFRELLDERGFDCIATNHQEREMGLLNIVVTKRSERAIGFAGAARIGEEMAKYGIGLESFSADEMWQGNGGAHCMTCPFLLG